MVAPVAPGRPGRGGPARRRGCRAGTAAPAGSVGARSKRGTTPLPVPNAGATRSSDRRVVDVAGDRHDDVRRPIGRRPELADRRASAGPGCRPRRRRSRGRGRVAEHRLLDEDLGVLGRIVEVRPDLLDDHRSLVVDLVVLAARGRTISSARTSIARSRLARRDADPVDGRLAVGRGVEAAAARPRSPRRSPGSSGRRAVPLNVMCSMKWATPACSGASRREPART